MAILLEIPTNLTTGPFSDPRWGFSRAGSVENTPITTETYASYGSGQSIVSKVISDGTDQTYRAELTGVFSGAISGVNRGIVEGVERWFGFSVMFPEDNPAFSSFSTGFFQILQTSANWLPEGFAGPNLVLTQSRGKFHLIHAWDATLNNTNQEDIRRINAVNLGTFVYRDWETDRKSVV